MKILANTLVRKILFELFEHVIIPIAQEFVKKSDNTWDDKCLDFLLELKAYATTKLAEK